MFFFALSDFWIFEKTPKVTNIINSPSLFSIIDSAFCEYEILLVDKRCEKGHFEDVLVLFLAFLNSSLFFSTKLANLYLTNVTFCIAVTFDGRCRVFFPYLWVNWIHNLFVAVLVKNWFFASLWLGWEIYDFEKFQFRKFKAYLRFVGSTNG